MFSNTFKQTALAALLLTLPLALAQGPAPPAAGLPDAGKPEEGKQDPTKPPPGAPSGAVAQQGDETQKDWAQWYSNDYDCVINCLQVYNGAPMERNETLENSWRTCVLEACDAKYMAQNVFQGKYIQEMFYDTGSIYECDGKPCPRPEGDSKNPDAASISADTPTGAASGEHSATPAVSMPGVNKGSGSTTIATETASESVTAASDGNSGAGKIGWNAGSGLAVLGVMVGAMMVL